MAFNILIVDDSLLARSFIAKALTVSGVDVGHVFEAANGREGLDVLKKEWIDVVFADINMPEMNGIEMVRHMVEDGIMKSVPVVVISTDRSATRMAELKAAGVRVYLNKPLTPENLKQAIDSVVEK